MEIPKDVTEKNGKNGELIYSKGFKAGRLEGQHVAKSPFATECNSLVNQILKGKDKENYKAPTADTVGKLSNTTFKFGGTAPDRNALKRLATTTLKCIEAMALPPKKGKSTTPPQSPPTPQTN